MRASLLFQLSVAAHRLPCSLTTALMVQSFLSSPISWSPYILPKVAPLQGVSYGVTPCNLSSRVVMVSKGQWVEDLPCLILRYFTLLFKNQDMGKEKIQSQIYLVLSSTENTEPAIPLSNSLGASLPAAMSLLVTKMLHLCSIETSISTWFMTLPFPSSILKVIILQLLSSLRSKHLTAASSMCSPLYMVLSLPHPLQTNSFRKKNASLHDPPMLY